MALVLKREGASPNLLKYSVVADAEGGEVVLSRDALIRDTVRGPLQTYVERGVRVDDPCRYLLCNPSMRTFVTPRTFARVAVDAVTEGPSSAVAFKIMAEPNATAIVALEFRHTLAA
jgi:hypothetical protein